jgi:putative Holliday junction resolvase
MERTLGIDYGEVRVGVAISDPLGSMALPLETLQVTGMRNAVEQVAAVCRAREVSLVVVGLPLNMDGTKGEMALKAEQFAGKLGDATGLAVKLQDERMSSGQVERVLLDADMSRSRRKQVRDKLAAQVILQAYLDIHAAPLWEDLGDVDPSV